MLSATDLTLSRGRRRIYDRLDVTFGPGITVVLGPNGAGKTTLIEGLLNPANIGGGQIRLGERIVPDQLAVLDYLARVGHMPQSWRYFSGFTVEQSVRYVAWLKRIPSGDADSAVARALTLVDLAQHARTKVGRLSGGMQQRVGLAEAIVNDPEVLLLDEPTVGLDPAQRATFRALVKAGASERAVVLSTHITDDVETLADRVLVVDSGRIIFDGTSDELARLGSRVEGATRVEAGYLRVVERAKSSES